MPRGQPGCTLLTSPDVIELALPAAGAAALWFDVPASAALPGVVLFEQAVPFELAAAGAITAATTSNALRLQIGAYGPVERLEISGRCGPATTRASRRGRRPRRRRR